MARSGRSCGKGASVMIHDHGEIAEPEADHGFPEVAFKALFTPENPELRELRETARLSGCTAIQLLLKRERNGFPLAKEERWGQLWAAHWLSERGPSEAEVRAAINAVAARDFEEWADEWHALAPQENAEASGISLDEILAGEAAEERERILDQLVADRQDGRTKKFEVEPMPGLRTKREAADRLRCSEKTVDAYVEAGELRYVLVGRGTRRQRKMFTDGDIADLLASRTRKAAPPCPFTKTRARHIGSSTSNGEVVAFSAQPRPRPGAKLKR